MPRRTACVVAAVAVVVLVGLLFGVRVDYAVLGPGPTCNTVGNGTATCPSGVPGRPDAPLISVPAADDHPSGSHLSLLTVSENDDRPSAGSAIWDWLRAGHAVVPEELEVPPGQTSGQVQQQNASDMVQAQDSAVVAAELQLGLDRAQVATVSPGSPAAGVLHPGDLLVSVDGRAVDSAAALIAATAGTSTTTVYAIGVERDGTTRTVRLHKALVGGRPLIGAGLQDFPTVPVTITLNADRIGGPSAGLMFSLGVYDLLTPDDLTGSLVVAGTGTIGQDSGNPLAVGAIGGIAQKMYAAAHDLHAGLFLAPQANCPDTRGAVPKGLLVVPVSTMPQALAVIAKVRAGDTTGLPHC